MPWRGATRDTQVDHRRWLLLLPPPPPPPPPPLLLPLHDRLPGGTEWWLMKEAKARNPSVIHVYCCLLPLFLHLQTLCPFGQAPPPFIAGTTFMAVDVGVSFQV